MLSKILFLLALFSTVNAISNTTRVKIKEDIKNFLATLEPYEHTRNDVVFLLDESGSIGLEKFQEVKYFTQLIARQFSVSSALTRVAVVTFATSTETHVDYIKYPDGNNMCTLISKIGDIEYKSGWTHTRLAMEEAEKILKLARPNSNKLIILLTDGESTGGYNPIAIAKVLKSQGIIIFGVGVGNYNLDEIYAVATSLNHTFLLNEFDYITQVNSYLINDTKDDSLDLAKDDSYCKISCDENAKCYCGARTGIYECTCKEGYYGTAGRKGECHACPRGTFKTQPGNSGCTPCPKNSTTLRDGSTSLKDCLCDLGFEKIDNFCSPVRCAVLSAPVGGILIPTHCNNTYGTECSFKCNIGHCPFSCKEFPPHPMDNQFILPKRTCLENRKWSNQEFHCEKMTCPALSYPLHGKHNCSEKDFTYGTACHFECEKGYDLYGPKTRTCDFKGWSGQDVKCKIIHCGKVKTNDLLNVKPLNCSTNSMPYRSICRYHCRKGYSLVLEGSKADGALKCEADKMWSHDYETITCKDIERPVIKCPKSITVNTDPGRNFATVNWTKATAKDNVGIADIRIIEPKGVKPPYAFPINTTKIVYEAVDYTKLKETCSFAVEVLDKELPKVLWCPSDIEVYTLSNKPIPVKWDEPQFEDNSEYVKVSSNKKSNDKFGWGPAFEVIYVAADAAKNNVSCTFSVKVKNYPCPYFEPPANGLVTCDTWNEGRICSVFCHDGFEFASSENDHVYLCNVRQQNGGIVGKWEPFMMPGSARRGQTIRGQNAPWPDCSRKLQPAFVNVEVGISYSVDSCSEKVLQKMREEFFKRVKKLPGLLCPIGKGCSPENVNVTCTSISTRRKRSFDLDAHPMYREYNPMFKHRREYTRLIRETPKLLTVSFSLLMHANETGQTSDVKVPEQPYAEDGINLSSNTYLKNLESEISLQVKDIYNLTSVPKTEVSYGITAICSSGQLSVNKSCVNCPAGTYKEDISESCIACPAASYQDEEGQSTCKPCPVDYTTYGVKSKSLSDCKGPCQPGTYSETTFEPCFACPLNTYQERSVRKECLKCPAGLYTWKVGANSSSDCVAPCKPGTFSDTGYEPCTLCDIGSYQEKEMQKECIPCPYGTSTAIRGVIMMEDCKEIDICDELRPCQYNSTCVQLDKEYECTCPKGLLGKHCEVNLDDCESSPCLNNGTCVDRIGNFTCLCPDGWEGHQCETDRDDCKPNPCFNDGECIDKTNAYECECKPGFTGDRCEKNIYECESNPCMNNGTCFDMQNDYRCCCPKCYFGKSCEKKLNTSLTMCDSTSCQNGGTCFTNDDGFNCKCLPGFEGEFCEFGIDNCEDHQCENGGNCINGNEGATCICPSKFVGDHCEEALFPEFVLSFPEPDTSNYAKAENPFHLYEITVSFFMRTSLKDSNSRATPVSYSYRYQNHLQDNALTFYDTNNIVLFIHGQVFHTEFSANGDSSWHHYALTWEKMDGKWIFYVDGNIIESGIAGKGKYMHPGTFILGQEQDDVGGQFSTLEAFAGDITEFNVWDYALTSEEIKIISSACGYVGNLIPWYTLSQSVHGDVKVSQDVDKCKAIGNCPENSCDCFYSNTKEFSCKAEFNCSSGFEGRHCEYDVDECLEQNGGCNYICVNDVGTGSYHCECPDDMVLSEDGRTCKDTSYCMKDGQIYVDGESWVDSCQNCVCNHGIVDCDAIVCNETSCYPEETLITSPGECCPKCVAWSFCLISSNNTLVSFDMSKYHIEGECTYTAVEDCFGGRFKVQIESHPNAVNESKLIIYQDCYKVVLSSNGNVLVDGSIVALPFHNEELVIEYNDSSVSVKTQSDLFVQWNFIDEAVIAVPITDVHKVCGVCSRIEEYYLQGSGKFPLKERFSIGEKECFIVSEAFGATHTRKSSSLSILSSSKELLVLLLNAFVYFFMHKLCSY